MRFQTVIKLKWSCCWGWWVLIKFERHLNNKRKFGYTWRHRGYANTEERPCGRKWPRREASEENRPANTLTMDFQPLELQGHKFCCVNHTVCHILLWQPSQLITCFKNTVTNAYYLIKNLAQSHRAGRPRGELWTELSDTRVIINMLPELLLGWPLHVLRYRLIGCFHRM